MIRPDPGARIDAAGRLGGPRQLVGIQYLRGIAALLVALFHLLSQFGDFRPYYDSYLLGRLNLPAGVDIFFVISGFIMLVANRNSRPGAFVVRRLVRIVPLYWILTLLLAAAALMSPGLFRATTVTAGALVKSLLFIPYVNQLQPPTLFPLLVPGWSLNLEMFFYAVFALALFAPSRWRLLAVGAVLGALVMTGMLDSAGMLPAPLRFYTSVRLAEFWLGMLIAHYVVAGSVKMPRYAALLIAAGGLALLMAPAADSGSADTDLRFLVGNALPAAMVVLGVVALELGGALPAWAPLRWLGDASYSIYLTHIFSLGAARVAWHRLGLDAAGGMHAAGFALFGMALAVIVGGCTYRFVERPMLAVLQRRVRRRPGAVSPGTAGAAADPVPLPAIAPDIPRTA